jgi:hypothetical protein
MTKAMAIPPAVLLQHLGILGKTGRGKTTTAKVCVEQVYDEDARVCILDPIKSDWWGITSSADGKRAGLPFYILGGEHGHLPLSSSSGKAIADLVARGQLRHTIIDMANFEPGGQVRWFADFAPRLMQKMKGVLYLVMEEAHLFAPKERIGMGYENLSIHWAKMLATAGRTKGIRLIVLSQRTQAVHNALLGSLDSMIVHGMTAPADMEPVIKWLKANTKDKELLARIEGSLSSLKTGTGWMCSSEAGIFALQEFPRARTYDNTATPEDDSELAAVKVAPVDLDGLRGILGKAAAEAEASDPILLRKRVTELEALLAREKTQPPVSGRELAAAENAGFDRGTQMGNEAGFRKGYCEAIQRAREIAGGLVQPALEALTDAHGNLQARLGALIAALPKAPAVRVMTPAVRSEGRILPVTLSVDAQKAIQERSKRDPGAPHVIVGSWNHPTQADQDGIALNNVSHPYGGLSGRILGALRWCAARGMTSASRAMVAALAGSSSTVGHTARVMGQLKTEGLVLHEPPGELTLTEAGRAVAPAPPPFDDPLEAWMAVAKPLQKEILRVMATMHPQTTTLPKLAKAMGKSEVGHFARTVGELRTMQAVYSPAKGILALSRYVMP